MRTTFLAASMAIVGVLALGPSEAHARWWWAQPVGSYYSPAYYYAPSYYYAPAYYPVYTSYYAAPAYYPTYTSYYAAPAYYYPTYSSYYAAPPYYGGNLYVPYGRLGRFYP